MFFLNYCKRFWHTVKKIFFFILRWTCGSIISWKQVKDPCFFFPRTQIPLGLCEEWNLIFKNERKRKYLLNKTYNLWIREHLKRLFSFNRTLMCPWSYQLSKASNFSSCHFTVPFPNTLCSYPLFGILKQNLVLMGTAFLSCHHRFKKGTVNQ